MRFIECPLDRIGHEAAYLVDIHMFVFGFHEVAGKIAMPAALATVQDHGRLPSGRPSAASRSARMADTAAQAEAISSSVSGVTGSAPIFTALASWLRLLDRRDWPSSASTRQRRIVLERGRPSLLPDIRLKDQATDVDAERHLARPLGQQALFIIGQPQGKVLRFGTAFAPFPVQFRKIAHDRTSRRGRRWAACQRRVL